MNPFIRSISIYQVQNFRCHFYLFSLSCGKDQSLSTMKSPLNSSSNPQSVLGRLCHSDGSQSLSAEWWQFEIKRDFPLSKSKKRFLPWKYIHGTLLECFSEFPTCLGLGPSQQIKKIHVNRKQQRTYD